MKKPVLQSRSKLKDHGRRNFLRTATAAATTLATGGILTGCDRTPGEPQSPVSFAPGKPLPWINWAGNQSCFPTARLAPASEDELVSMLKTAKGVVRAVGASHSFSAVVPTNDTLITTDLLSGLIGHDPDAVQAEIWAGTRMHALGPLLDAVGQALPNQPDMDYPAMGGAIACSAHATGKGFGSMSSYVTGLTLATPSGELLECSANQHPEIFQAARVSLGTLGIVSRIKLQNVPSFRLVETNRVEKTEQVLEEFNQRIAQHRHFEFLPLPHTSLCATVTTDIASDKDVAIGEEDSTAAHTLRKVFNALSWLPAIGDATYEKVLTLALGGAGTEVRVGKSFEVFPHVRTVRFREMEYTVPAEHGAACLREILDTIKNKSIPVCFPLEFRFVRADDIWLSMFEGRDGITISAHQYGDLDYKAYFAQIEPIFWKYQGRPHWGKIHTLNATQLAALYPRHWQDFKEIRAQLDPKGTMLNNYMKSILGV